MNWKIEIFGLMFLASLAAQWLFKEWTAFFERERQRRKEEDAKKARRLFEKYQATHFPDIAKLDAERLDHPSRDEVRGGAGD